MSCSRSKFEHDSEKSNYKMPHGAWYFQNFAVIETCSSLKKVKQECKYCLICNENAKEHVAKGIAAVLPLRLTSSMISLHGVSFINWNEYPNEIRPLSSLVSPWKGRIFFL